MGFQTAPFEQEEDEHQTDRHWALRCFAKQTTWHDTTPRRVLERALGASRSMANHNDTLVLEAPTLWREFVFVNHHLLRRARCGKRERRRSVGRQLKVQFAHVVTSPFDANVNWPLK